MAIWAALHAVAATWAALLEAEAWHLPLAAAVLLPVEDSVEVVEIMAEAVLAEVASEVDADKVFTHLHL